MLKKIKKIKNSLLVKCSTYHWKEDFGFEESILNLALRKEMTAVFLKVYALSQKYIYLLVYVH